MTTARVPLALLQLRRRTLRVVAVALAVGMAALAVVIPTVSPGASWVDAALLALVAGVHAAAAATVGRRWEPGGAVCAAYLLVVVAFVGVGVALSVEPASDAFWFVLVPTGLSALTMSLRPHAVIAVAALAAYVVGAAVGPGLDPAWALPRLVAGAIFAVVMAGLGHRLEQALLDVEAARADLHDQYVELGRVTRRLEELDRAKDVFVATVAHELRTPLTTIVGSSSTLGRLWNHLSDGERRMMVEQVARNARGLSSIVATMLDLARIERGGFVPDTEPVDLVAIVDDAALRLVQQLQEHELVTEVPDGLELRSDAGLLERVLDNLLLNAARHTPPGTVVRVRAAQVPTGVRVEVVDEGRGLPPEQLERLGEWFYRAGADDAERTIDGVGIGLALVGEVLEALGSRLEVSSALGEGTSFAFVLPVDQTRASSEVS